MTDYERIETRQKPSTVTWGNGIVLTALLGAVSWLTMTVVNLDKASDNGPIVREMRNRTDDRHDQDVRDQLSDLRARLITVEARCR